MTADNVPFSHTVPLIIRVCRSRVQIERLPRKPESCKLLKQSCKMVYEVEIRPLDDSIARWKSTATADITDLLQRQTLIGRDNRFHIIPANQIIQVGDVAIASKHTEVTSKPRARKEYKCSIAASRKETQTFDAVENVIGITNA